MNVTNYSFYAALTHLQTFFGITLHEDDFETMGMQAWWLIGNKRSRRYKLIQSTVNQRIPQPCNLSLIESVHLPYEDYRTTNNINKNDNSNLVIEQFVENRKDRNSATYQRGKLIDFYQEENDLVFDKDYNDLIIIYKGIIADENGLPFINQKEMVAIATYCAYAYTYKKAYTTKDSQLFQFAADLQKKWNRACLQARTPEYMSQNDMDAILDVQFRWDRKRYNQSYKPII